MQIESQGIVQQNEDEILKQPKIFNFYINVDLCEIGRRDLRPIMIEWVTYA